jgi:hypothetical protein
MRVGPMDEWRVSTRVVQKAATRAIGYYSRVEMTRTVLG